MSNFDLLTPPSGQGGLLEGFNRVAKFAGSPLGQGLLSATFAGLANAKRGAPLNALGVAGQAGLLGYARAQDDELAANLRKARLDEIEQQRAFNDLARKHYRSPGSLAMEAGARSGGGIGPTKENAALIPTQRPRFDFDGFISEAWSVDPMRALQLQSQSRKESPFSKVDPKDYTAESVAKFNQTGNYADLEPRVRLENTNGVWANPYTGDGVKVAPQNPNQPFVYGSDGKPVPNVAFQQYEMGRTKAGAPRTNVRVENRMGESLAGQVGPMVKAGYDGAEGALAQADAADRVMKALNSGKVLAGPGASMKLYGLQLANALGIRGGSTEEILLNTRSTVKGLAEFSLNARKSLAGQGQITENEQALLTKAVSGDIDSLTAPEIQQIAQITRRQAEKLYGRHQSNVDRLRSDPSLSGLADFYSLPSLPGQGAGEINFGDLK